MIDWISNDKNSAITIYNNNITLSKHASRFFEDAYGVNVGVDVDSKELIIKKVSKEEFDNGSNCHKIEIKASYGRISSKALVSKICEKLGLNFNNQQSLKFDAKWNNAKRMLIVETNRKEGQI